MNCLRVKNVSKSFGYKKVLNNIELEVEEGSVVTLIGPSGVGKTTLLNIIMGLCFKDEGEIVYDDKILNIPYPKDIRKRIAYIPDTPIFYDYLTGVENLKYLREIYNSEISDSEIEGYLEQFNLFQSKDMLFKNYSKGMKQKLMLLSTYISNASLLILDEPTTGLDLVSSYELKEIILQFKRMKKTILLATHDINFTENVSDEIAIISDGSIVYKGCNNGNAKLQDVVMKYLKK